MKQLLLAAALFTAAFTTVIARDDAPRGYMPISELEEARGKAGGRKLVVVVVKGEDDACPNCVTAMENGERAVGSGVVKVFARADAMNKTDAGSYPPALRDRVSKKFTTGAWVTFLVFDPGMEKLLAESSRKELQSDKKLTAAFKKKVQAAKREYK